MPDFMTLVKWAFLERYSMYLSLVLAPKWFLKEPGLHWAKVLMANREKAARKRSFFMRCYLGYYKHSEFFDHGDLDGNLISL